MVTVAAPAPSVKAGCTVLLSTAQVWIPSPPIFAGGQGKNGLIKITYAIQTGLVASYAGAAGVDGSGNRFSNELMGPVSVQSPVSGLTVVEAWHSLGVGGSGAGVNGMFYRLTSESEVELIWDFAVSGVSGYIVGTVPSRYFP
jgi:hypothetical protein